MYLNYRAVREWPELLQRAERELGGQALAENFRGRRTTGT
jgi:hypothetical protein